MELGTTLLIISLLIIAVWVVFETKRMRHKLLAIFLIGLILFSYFSFNTVFKDKDVNLKSFDGIKTATNLYFSWLGAIFTNFKILTANAIHMNWKSNETELENTR